jgi:hypothetical protein
MMLFDIVKCIFDKLVSINTQLNLKSTNKYLYLNLKIENMFDNLTIDQWNRINDSVLNENFIMNNDIKKIIIIDKKKVSSHTISLLKKKNSNIIIYDKLKTFKNLDPDTCLRLEKNYINFLQQEHQSWADELEGFVQTIIEQTSEIVNTKSVILALLINNGYDFVDTIMEIMSKNDDED